MYRSAFLDRIRTAPFPEKREKEDRIAGVFTMPVWGCAGGILYSRLSSHHRTAEKVRRATTKMELLEDVRLKKDCARMRRIFKSSGASKIDIIGLFALIVDVTRRTTGCRLSKENIEAGLSILDGMIAEVDANSDKWFSLVLPVCAAALTGIPVHCIMANNASAKRRLELMNPVYGYLGIEAALVYEGMGKADRKEAYESDIIYATSTQIAFDYLHDKLMMGPDGSGRKTSIDRMYMQRTKLDHLVTRGLCCAFIEDADVVLIDDAMSPISLSGGVPIRAGTRLYAEALRLAGELKENEGFVVNGDGSYIELTSDGKQYLEKQVRDMPRIWKGRKPREYLILQALYVMHYYRRDEHYSIANGVVIERQIQRVTRGRSINRDTQRLIKIKEQVERPHDKEALARISYQRFINRYLLMGGVTCTARECAGEFWQTYRTLVFNRSGSGSTSTRKYIALSKKDKVNYSVEKIVRSLKDGMRPLLLADSTDDVREIAKHLSERSILFKVIARADDISECNGYLEGEVLIVSSRLVCLLIDQDSSIGELKRRTHVIKTGRADSRRSVRKLIKVYGGGNIEIVASLEDEYFHNSVPSLLLKGSAWVYRTSGDLPGWLQSAVVTISRKSLERRSKHQRADVVRMDEYLDRMLAFAGQTV